jgi:TrmH family RNA methyltransferase
VAELNEDRRSAERDQHDDRGHCEDLTDAGAGHRAPFPARPPTVRRERTVVPTALSPHNPRIERVRELRHARTRRERAVFTLEGSTLLGEALRSGLVLEELYGTAAALTAGAELVAEVERAGVPAFELTDRVLARLSDVETPPGLLAVARQVRTPLAELLARPGPVLLLAGVGDPGNAGTLVRTAEAFGAAGVIFGRGGADPYAPKVVRAAMGSLFRLAIAVAEPDELLAAAAAAGRPVIATATDGEPLSTARLDPHSVIAVGSERHGVGSWLPRWDRAVRIEQQGPTESLNAAVAGAIVLYALRAENTPK